ncbi:MAG: hypothetical protein Q8N47_02020 [Bryobacterales bacterium]|nr:hypothetical protein [Bryobacterales bacterium]
MGQATEHSGWKCLNRVDFEDGVATRYTIAFYRQNGEWYDEIRYDSHEWKRGRNVSSPHFHLKLRSAKKGDLDAAVEEIRQIIDEHVDSIREVIER